MTSTFKLKLAPVNPHDVWSQMVRSFYILVGIIKISVSYLEIIQWSPDQTDNLITCHHLSRGIFKSHFDLQTLPTPPTIHPSRWLRFYQMKATNGVYNFFPFLSLKIFEYVQKLNIDTYTYKIHHMCMKRN